MHNDHYDEGINLVFDSKRLRVAGETIEGEVQLTFPKVMEDKVEEVHIKLRGAVVTYAPSRCGRKYIDTQRPTTGESPVSILAVSTVAPATGATLNELI